MDDTKTKTIYVNQLWTTLCLNLAFWPVWAWYIARTFDKSDEPWGLVALATAVAILIFGSHRQRSTESDDGIARCDASASQAFSFSQAFSPGHPGFLAGAACLGAYVITYAIAPHLVQAILLILTVWFFVVSKIASPSKTGLLGLFVLSLPLVPSLNFFLGYPLRVIVAAGTCFMLSNLGISASREGIMLSVNGQLTAIDTPCSGISMLWAESYVVMLLACIFKLNLKYTSILCSVAVLFIVGGNIVRATSLITFDKIVAAGTIHNLSQWEPSVHVGAGLVVFSAVCGFTIMVASLLERRMLQNTEAQNGCFAALGFRFSQLRESQRAAMALATQAHIPSVTRIALIPLCLAAALIPLIAHPTGSTVSTAMPPAWPREINGKQVISVDSLAEERAFAQDFPGQMKRFTDGTNSYFVRFVQKETRQLHPSSDCFKGLGYQIEPHPISVAQDGSRWGSFEACKGSSRYLILERIYDDRGFSSTDVSEWYWLACLGKTHGPWFDVTIAQPLHL